MKCSRCGAEVKAEAKFCPMCGNSMEFSFSKAIIDAAAQGNEKAITELYNRTYNSVYQSVRMMIKDEDAALDIVQDAYIRGFQHLNQLHEPGNYRAWMKRIAMNTAQNYLRKKQPILFSEMEGAEDEERPEVQFVDERQENLPEVAIERQETARLINEILDTLSDEQRLVITMYYYEEMNAREIADELGVNENTIRSRLNYGKKKIEEKVLEIEKRDGIRLHSIAPITFLLLLFRSGKRYTALPDMAVLRNIHIAVETAAAVGTGTAATSGAGTVATSGAGTAATFGAKAAVGSAVKGIGIKIATGITVTAIAAGGGTAYAVHRYQELEQSHTVTEEWDENENKVEEKFQAENLVNEGLEAFGKSHSILAGTEYKGYLNCEETDYHAVEDSDLLEIPEGWLDYKIADFDRDEKMELAAVLLTRSHRWNSIHEFNDIDIMIEMYEWDEEKEEVYLADSVSLSDFYEPWYNYFNPDEYFRVIDCFTYGEEPIHIGMVVGIGQYPDYENSEFYIAKFLYKDGKINNGLTVQAYKPGKEVFYDTENVVNEIRDAGIFVDEDMILQRHVETADNIKLYVENYTSIGKIVSESIVDTRSQENRIDNEDQPFDYGDRKPISIIRCYGKQGS